LEPASGGEWVSRVGFVALCSLLLQHRDHALAGDAQGANAFASANYQKLLMERAFCELDAARRGRLSLMDFVRAQYAWMAEVEDEFGAQELASMLHDFAVFFVEKLAEAAPASAPAAAAAASASSSSAAAASSGPAAMPTVAAAATRSKFCRAVHAFAGGVRQDAELQLAPEMPVLVLEEDASGWWLGRSAVNQTGWFPAAYVRVVESPDDALSLDLEFAAAAASAAASRPELGRAASDPLGAPRASVVVGGGGGGGGGGAWEEDEGDAFIRQMRDKRAAEGREAHFDVSYTGAVNVAQARRQQQQQQAHQRSATSVSAPTVAAAAATKGGKPEIQRRGPRACERASERVCV
jgi:hypothetical protein